MSISGVKAVGFIINGLEDALITIWAVIYGSWTSNLLPLSLNTVSNLTSKLQKLLA